MDEEKMRAYLQSADFKNAMDANRARLKKDSEVIESAPWFGKTGLGDDLERELPKYLRREFGESPSDPKALKASELDYVGVYVEGDSEIHYWRIPSQKKEIYAYAEHKGDETILGWGNKRPPTTK